MFGAVTLTYVKCLFEISRILFQKDPVPHLKNFLTSEWYRIFLNYASKFRFFRMVKDLIFDTVLLLKPIFKCVRNFPTVKISLSPWGNFELCKKCNNKWKKINKNFAEWIHITGQLLDPDPHEESESRRQKRPKMPVYSL